MKSDPKNTSLVGEFLSRPVKAARESFELLEAINATIEGFENQNAGNNCLFTPKPHIINATNIDTESIVGEIGIRKTILSLTESANASVDFETIDYSSIVNNLPATGSRYKYLILNMVWIGSAYNNEDVSEVLEDSFVGMDLSVPTSINLKINTTSDYIYLPTVPTVGFASTMMIMNQVDKYPRSLLMLAFPIVLLVPDEFEYLEDEEIMYVSETISQTSPRRYPYTRVNSIDVMLNNVEMVEYSPDVYTEILINNPSGSYDQPTLIKPTQFTYGYLLYYKVVQYNGETPPADPVEGTVDNPGMIFDALSGITISNSCKMIFTQVINGVAYNTDVFDYLITLPIAMTPNISEVDNLDGTFTITIEKNSGVSPEEDAVTDLWYSVDEGVPNTQYIEPFIVTGPITINAQAKATDNPATHQSSAITEFFVEGDSGLDLPSPTISPNGGTFLKSIPKVSAIVSPGIGSQTVNWVWTGIEESEPAHNDPSWNSYTLSANSDSCNVSANQSAGDQKKLWCYVSKTGFQSSETVSATFVITGSIIIAKAGITSVDDGFDNKITRKNIDLIKVNRSDFPAGRTVDQNAFHIKFAIDVLTDPSISMDYDTEESASDIISNGTLPRMTQSFLIYPMRDGYTHSYQLPLYTAEISYPSRWRKQLGHYDSSIDLDKIDMFLSKKQDIVYQDDLCAIYLNTYKHGINGQYCHCFSIVDIANQLETYPVNFSSGLTNSDKVIISKISILSNLDSGPMKAIISYTIDGINRYAYLSLSRISDYYPSMAGSTSISYILSETLVYSNGTVPGHGIPMTAIDFTHPQKRMSDVDGITPIVTYNCLNAMRTPQKLVYGRLLYGNEMALVPDPLNLSVPTKLTHGAQLFAMMLNHHSDGLFTWKDGIERYAPVMIFPTILPITMDIPDSLAYYGKRNTQGYSTFDNLIFDQWTESLTHLTMDQIKAYKERIAIQAEIFDKIPSITGEIHSGTVAVIQTPKILPGGAYNEVSSTATDLTIDTIATKLVYGDEVENGLLHTDLGVYKSSKWEYLSNSDKRISSFGTTTQITMLENYIFAVENGNCCVYWINEKQGKNLLFNEIGSFIDRPVIYKGSPYFAINTGSNIRLYRVTQDGVLALRQFEATEAIMVHISGYDPALLVKTSTGYDVWCVDNLTIYYNGPILITDTLYVQRIALPGEERFKLLSGSKEYSTGYTDNTSMIIESSDVYPSLLSYDYEPLTFICDGIVIRFNTSRSDQYAKIGPGLPDVLTKRFAITIKYNGKELLYNSPASKILCESEVKISFDSTPVKCLSYVIKSDAPIRAIRYTGHFVEDLKVD